MIPEAAVDAAAKALWDVDREPGTREYEDCRDWTKRHLRREACAVLEAAAPHIIQAWVDEKAPLPEKLPSYRPIYPLGKIEDKRRHGND